MRKHGLWNIKTDRKRNQITQTFKKLETLTQGKEVDEDHRDRTKWRGRGAQL